MTEVVDAAGPLGSYSYSADGEVTLRSRDAQPSLLLLRDDDGRIAQVNAAIAYRYDEAGERSRKTSSTVDTLYVDPEYEVYLANAKHQVHYFYGSRRIASRNRSGLGLPGNPGTNLSWQYYFPDFVGSNSVVALSDGQVQRSFFRPFGEFAQTGPDLTPYLFTDQEHDAETGLDYFGARYYDPWVGRFLGPDPALLGYEPGVTFERIADDAQNLNPYSYVANRPTVFVDPTGEYGRGTGFSDRQWKKFDKAQQKAAREMEGRADEFEAKADKLDAKGETGGDSLRSSARNLRAGADVLRNDGSDGKTLANAVDSKTYRGMGGSANGAAMVHGNSQTVTVNKDHRVWSRSDRTAQFAIGHESLHSAGMNDQHWGGRDGPLALKNGDRRERNAYREMKNTPQADMNPDHLMDEVY